MRRGLGLGAVGLILLAALAAWRTAGTPAGTAEGERADTAALAARGEAVYAAHCAACHGPDGAGQANWRVRKPNGKLPAPPLNGTGHTWHHPDPQLRAMITDGVAAMVPGPYATDMRGFGDRLSDADIDAVLAHIKTWWSPEHRARQAEITARSGDAG